MVRLLSLLTVTSAVQIERTVATTLWRQSVNGHTDKRGKESWNCLSQMKNQAKGEKKEGEKKPRNLVMSNLRKGRRNCNDNKKVVVCN